VLTTLVALLALPSGAQAAFPGPNGKIAFSSRGNIETIYADGVWRERLTTTGQDFEPAWSADGARIVFSSNRDGNYEIYVMDADGSNQTRLTNDPARDMQPAWSPDGRKIVFTRVAPYYELYVMNADGSGSTSLTNGQGGSDAVWSPDGRRIAFIYGNNVFTMNADGTDRVNVTNYAPDTRASYHDAGDPDWSPDGNRIAFDLIYGGSAYFFYSINIINSDGTGNTEFYFGSSETPGLPAFSPDGTRVAFACSAGLCLLTPAVGWESARPIPGSSPGVSPDWQQGPPRGPGPFDYVAPGKPSPVRVSLVPAYLECRGVTNSAHGYPFPWGSCKPPAQQSGDLTIGTPATNGKGANSVGSVTYEPLVGDPSTAADEADVRMTLRITDVRNRSDLSDYTGEVSLFSTFRITDHNNYTGADTGAAGPDSGTAPDTFIKVAVPCAATPDPSSGSTCQVTTTEDTLMPGMVPEGARTIWQLGVVQVLDAHSGVFMRQGVFVP
jgi:WD40 repeat protein